MSYFMRIVRSNSFLLCLNILDLECIRIILGDSHIFRTSLISIDCVVLELSNIPYLKETKSQSETMLNKLNHLRDNSLLNR